VRVGNRDTDNEKPQHQSAHRNPHRPDDEQAASA
jgi:hypothetical protein